VVTDMVMPRMGGPEMVEKLRCKRSDFTVIFMSGYTEAAVLENARIGKNAVLLSKPFSTDTLLRRIAEVCLSESETTRISSLSGRPDRG